MKKIALFSFALTALLLCTNCNKPDPKGNLTGTVKDEVSQLSIENASVELQLGGATKKTETTDSKGEFSFMDIEPAQYTLKVKANGYSENTITATVSDGLTETVGVNLLPSTGRIEGKVKDAESGDVLANAAVQLKKDGSSVNNFTTGSDGAFAFNDLVPGSYSIEASKNGDYQANTRTITVESGKVANGDINLSSTESGKPTVSTKEPSNVSINHAYIIGNITSTGNKAVTAHGHCWSLSPAPDINDFKIDYGEASEGEYTSTLADLEAGTKYYVRAFATNSNGTSYSSEINFTTENDEHSITITTSAVSSITTSSAVSGGNIVADGATITARGVCWSTATNPTISNNFTADGTGLGSFTSELTNLNPNTLYYVRAYATHSAGTSYGNPVNFTTDEGETTPTISTTEISALDHSSAMSGGNITSSGGTPVTARGVCWNTVPNPTIGDFSSNDGSGIGTFESSLTNLSPSTTYYVRAYATNKTGTGYGTQIEFTTWDAPINFPDANFEAAVREAINKPSGGIYKEDVEDVTELILQEKNISSITGIEYFTSLDILDLMFNDVVDVTPLADLTQLTQLTLGNNPTSDLSSLSKLVNLGWFSNFGDRTTVTDFSVLENFTKLHGLHIGRCPNSNWKDYIPNMTYLYQLYLTFMEMDDISFLANFTNLYLIDIGDNNVTDISVLENLTDLTNIGIAANPITSIDPIMNKTNCVVLQIYDINISDISFLEDFTKLEFVNMNSNNITDISALVNNTGIGDGDEIWVKDNPLDDNSLNTHIPALEGRGVTVYYGDWKKKSSKSYPSYLNKHYRK